MKDWKIEHGNVIRTFLTQLNKQSDGYILKGDTALMICYGLDCFSEDVDLDGRKEDGSIFTSIDTIVDTFCDKMGFQYRIAKNTDIVKRFMIHYRQGAAKPLKVEVSYSRHRVADSEICKINDITVYNINRLCNMKVTAYVNRDKIRDLYDVTYICNNFYDELEASVINAMQDALAYKRKSRGDALLVVINAMQDALAYKGLEYFDYVMATQSDDLVDSEKLVDNFLKMYDKLGMLSSKDEVKLADKLKDRMAGGKSDGMGDISL